MDDPVDKPERRSGQWRAEGLGCPGPARLWDARKSKVSVLI